MNHKKVNLKGRYSLRQFRKGELIWEAEVPNLVTDEGAEYILSSAINGGTAISTWYMGMVNDGGFTAFDPADTYEQIGGTNGWVENVAYTDTNNGASAATRPEWQEDAPVLATRSISNTTVASIVATSVTSIRGLFIAGGANAQTKSDATAGNILLSVAPLSVVRTLQVGDGLDITYTLFA